ncbi:Protein N-acetyltransferase, RimJ/RimL family [Priestia flexa]|nr:Protein N-acetyltransferase, RimJ/RimL family [Priestia flexa]SIQ75267.1 Protein N-acetyltransferase, RimJ/RimL family [Priestia flexa]
MIREIEMTDAPQFVEMIKQVETESQYMLFEENERKLSSEQQEKQIEMMKQQRNSTLLVAEVEGELVGYLQAVGGVVNRSAHIAYVSMGILKDYRGMGIGLQLFQQLEEWAKEQQIHRLELTVVVENVIAIHLYKKIGFQIEGTKKHSLRINGQYVDEYIMSKLLDVE